MNRFKVIYRISRFFKARSWRGHGIHSPFMYSLVREVVMRYPERMLAEKIENRYGSERVLQIERVEQIITDYYCNILHGPFHNAEQLALWNEFYRQNHCTVLESKGLLIIFFDPKLQKHHYCIRN